MEHRKDPIRLPIICAGESALACATLFNPNLWSGRSKGIVQSCWTECSVLHHCVRQLKEMCAAADHLCAGYVDAIRKQWAVAEFDVESVVILGEVPDLHMRIEAFFSGVKSLLDLLVQLLSSERVVNVTVHGFHWDKTIYGGALLNTLAHNASSAKKTVAKNVIALLGTHKAEWIDQTIGARDRLIHPGEGTFQLMFQLGFIERNREVLCTGVSPPAVGSEPIDRYSERVLGKAVTFASEFLTLLK
jgi:hypothetical protein